MSGIPRRAIADHAITPQKLDSSLQDGSYFYDEGNYQPMATTVAGTAFPAGGDGDEFLVHFKSGPVCGHNIGAATVLSPVLNTTTGRLALQLDKTNNEGVEYAFVADDNKSVGPFIYEVGASPSVFIRLKFTIDDVSELGECAVGFRKVQAFQAAIDNYTDMAVLNVQAGDVKKETILNNAATVTKDTTENWADGEEHEIKIVLDNRAGAGKARFFLDGEEVASSFTFDDGDKLVPFIHILQAVAASGAAVEVSEFEVAYVEDVDDYFVN